MPGVKSRGTGTDACPVTNCPFMGPSRAMTIHWRSFHEESILLYLCHLPRCSWQTPKPQGLRQHWENQHQASRQQKRGKLRTLPLLANFVKNKHRRDPGNCCPPVPPLQKPMGCLPHGSKAIILVQVQRILSTMRMPTPGQISLVAPHSLPGSLPATPPVLAEDQRVVVKDTPPLVAENQGMAAEMGLSPAVITVTPDRKPPTCLDSPIVIYNSPASTPVVPASVSTAFTALSTLTSVLLSSSLSILGSPSLPPVTSPGPDRDPVLGGLSPVMR